MDRVSLEDASPIDYTLRILISPSATNQNVVLHGEMNIRLNVHKETSVLQLHQLFLEVNLVEVILDDGSRCTAKEWHCDNDAERLAVTLEEALASDQQCTLRICYLADSDNVRSGNFRSWNALNCVFAGDNGDDDDDDSAFGPFHMMTQHEPMNARMTFPCYDDCAIKCPFQLTLTMRAADSPEHVRFLSNTDAVSDQVVDGLRVVQFERTIPMSTYLVGFVVGNFSVLRDQSDTGVAIRVYTKVGQTAEGEYAMSLAKAAFNFCQSLFPKNRYPLSKIDHVPSPAHPLLGMENYGLLTYRSDFFLVNENTREDIRKRIARLIAHETLHMWFGNDVGLTWWSALFLKEGFARLTEYRFVEQMFPEWNYWEHFQARIYYDVLQRDEKPSTHPIHREILNSKMAMSHVDLLSYAKGASVLRQLMYFVGDSLFWSGVSLYFQRHAQATAEPIDLWNAIGQVAQIDCAALMDSWVYKSGHPYISFSEDGATMEQHLCESSAGSLAAVGAPESFSIPVRWRLPGGPVHTMLFDSPSAVSPAPVAILNAGATGFYRVLYSESQLLELIQAARAGTLDQFEILALLQDAMFFLRRRRLDLRMLSTLLAELLPCLTSAQLWSSLEPQLLTLLMTTSLAPWKSVLCEPIASYLQLRELPLCELHYWTGLAPTELADVPLRHRMFFCVNAVGVAETLESGYELFSLNEEFLVGQIESHSKGELVDACMFNPRLARVLLSQDPEKFAAVKSHAQLEFVGKGTNSFLIALHSLYNQE